MIVGLLLSHFKELRYHGQMRALILRDHERVALEELKEKLQSFLKKELDCLVLFGSKARGDAEPGSDLDVAVIVTKISRPRKRQILDLVAQVELNHLVVFSVLVLSRTEFEQLKARERRIALDIEREGVVL